MREIAEIWKFLKKKKQKNKRINKFPNAMCEI